MLVGGKLPRVDEFDAQLLRLNRPRQNRVGEVRLEQIRKNGNHRKLFRCHVVQIKPKTANFVKSGGFWF